MQVKHIPSPTTVSCKFFYSILLLAVFEISDRWSCKGTYMNYSCDSSPPAQNQRRLTYGIYQSVFTYPGNWAYFWAMKHSANYMAWLHVTYQDWWYQICRTTRTRVTMFNMLRVRWNDRKKTWYTSVTISVIWCFAMEAANCRYSVASRYVRSRSDIVA